MMHILFVALVAGGGGYFLFARRRFDAISLAFASAVVYFLPGFFGYALSPQTLSQPRRLPIALIPETYAVFCLVLGALVLTALLQDRQWQPPRHELALPRPAVALTTLVIAAALGCLITVIDAGSSLLSPDKAVVMEAIGRWRIVWVTAASLGTLLAFVERRWRILAFCLALLLFDLYIGFRNHLALTTLALFTLLLHRKGRHRLALGSFKVLLVGSFAALGFFVYKFFYILVKRGDWAEIATRLSDSDYLLRTLTRSEPFITQAILNQVLAERFHTEFSGLKNVAFQLVLFSPRFGVEIESIATRFKDALFPGAVGGLGCNVWAEMWSRGGWVLLVVYVLLYCTALALASRLLAWRDPMIRSGVALAASYWAFYSHRNPLVQVVNLEKRVLLIWLLAAMVGLVVDALSRSVERGRAAAMAGSTEEAERR